MKSNNISFIVGDLPLTGICEVNVFEVCNNWKDKSSIVASESYHTKEWEYRLAFYYKPEGETKYTYSKLTISEQQAFKIIDILGLIKVNTMYSSVKEYRTKESLEKLLKRVKKDLMGYNQKIQYLQWMENNIESVL